MNSKPITEYSKNALINIAKKLKFIKWKKKTSNKTNNFFKF